MRPTRRWYSPAVRVFVLAPEECIDELLRRDCIPRSREDDGVIVAVLRCALAGVQANMV